ncbi:MAG: hypothetical protein ACLFM0_00435 [Spirochaetales bacterium]
MSRNRDTHRSRTEAAAPAGIIGIVVLVLILIFARAPWYLPDMIEQAPAATQVCDDAISLEEAWERASELEDGVHAVHGKVREARYVTRIEGRPTFLSLGAEYPRTPRLEALIWYRDRGAFLELFPEGPEHSLEGESVCVAGTVKIHDGIPQIELENPSQLLIE